MGEGLECTETARNGISDAFYFKGSTIRRPCIMAASFARTRLTMSDSFPSGNSEKSAIVLMVGRDHRDALECCHSRFARTVMPMRRGDSLVIMGPSGASMMRRPVRGEIPLSAHHSAKFRTRSSANDVSAASSASARCRGGVLRPRFLGCLVTSPVL